MGGDGPIRAVGLFSGGLDSTLAVRVMLEQGLAVTALHFRTGFSYIERARLTGREISESQADVERAAAQLGVPLEVIDVSDGFLRVVLDPQYGYGSGMNPCIDCRIFLLRQAKAWMEAHDHHFVFTGEVVGQRPKSQMRPTLTLVERESGLGGLLVRPLSAKLLAPTLPEIRGWVDRDRLYGIGGRGRREQIALAERFGIQDYPQPSGGCCYLIDQTYSRRLRDFLDHEGADALTSERAQHLAVGRHVRLPSGRKVIVGRHAGENAYLEARPEVGILLTTLDCPGPVTLVPGQPSDEELALAAQITASYSDEGQSDAVRVSFHRTDASPQSARVITVAPVAREQLHLWMV